MPDDRTYIRVHDGIEDHPKILPLSDGAFRLLMTTWCWSSKHLTDGRIPAAIWAKRGTPKLRRELAAAGLVEETTDGVQMHDYLEHQRSAAEVRALKAEKSAAGTYGNHERWHTNRGKVDPDCQHCVSPNGTAPPPLGDRKAIAPAIASGSQDRSQTDRKPSHLQRTDTETTTTTDQSRSVVNARYVTREPPPPDDDAPPDAHSQAGELAAHYAAGVPLTDHARATRTIAAALEHGITPDLIRAGLDRLIAEQRGCTPDQLRIAITAAPGNWRPANGHAQPQSKAEGWLTLDVQAGLAAMADRLGTQPPPGQPDLRALPGGAA